MAYVPVPNDLNRIKTRPAFSLTKRQLICFSIAGGIGVPFYPSTRSHIGNSIALFLMIGLMDFTNDRGVCAGPQPQCAPFVTWTFYENADGSRDYNRGHYFKDEKADGHSDLSEAARQWPHGDIQL